ncbi:hypothetical protein LZ480_13570 [Solibacillus sp. MA9]|uniref:Uncharacterized protein n=1 Tax=Solibacillus palustris TaxID=2908203 RepID=A0ABS9UFJ3_9BACL|nr:hypothetical protein [Solibacillus sp. MA9]MCH7322905.1 hypothetical protein [Solibacillus sp. MA9]
MVLKKNIKNKVYTLSDYEEGETKLSENEWVLLRKISFELNGYPDNYNGTVKNYSPRGLIDVLNGQVIAKLDAKLINEEEAKNIKVLISKFGEEILF